MNIAFALSYFAERFGGPVNVVRNLGPLLARQGHEVSYWATRAGDDAAPIHTFTNVHLYEVVWPHRWYRSPGLARGLEAAISSMDVLDINEMWVYSTYAASRVARKHQVPYVLRPAGSLEPWPLKRGLLRRLKKAAYLRVVGNTVMRAAACLQACSPLEAEHVRQVGYDGPITIIPNGVDIRTFDGGEPEEAEAFWPVLHERPVVVFMSRLSPEKGLDLLLPAWSQLVRMPAYQDALLVVAGPDYRGYQRTVEAMVERYSVQRSVLMPGMVRGRRKTALLRRADVFVLPSHSENFGIVIAEALACGTPVVTTTSTPWEQLHRIDAGRWVPPVETELLAALRELLALSAPQRAAMGRRGRDLVQSEYTWEKAAGRFLHVCRCILEGKPVPLHPPASEPVARQSLGCTAVTPRSP